MPVQQLRPTVLEQTNQPDCAAFIAQPTHNDPHAGLLKHVSAVVAQPLQGARCVGRSCLCLQQGVELLHSLVAQQTIVHDLRSEKQQTTPQVSVLL